MKFLSKIAKIAGKIVITYAGLEPVIRGFLPPDKQGVYKPINDTLLEVRDAIITVETLSMALADPNVRGPSKLIMAGPLVSDIILKSALVMNNKVKDEILFRQGSTKIADGMVDILNSLDDNIDEVNHG